MDYRTMKVTITVEYSEELWAREYGMDEKDALGIGLDVNEYIRNLIQMSPAAQSELIRVI